MKTLYIIGGNGFLGKNMVDCLYNKYKITVFDKCIDTGFFLNPGKAVTVKMDMTNEYIPAIYPAPDYIVNLTSIVTAEREITLFDDLINTNLKVLLRLFERFKDDRALKLFVQFGSAEEYGNAGIPFYENMRERPNSPYALVKQLTTNTGLMLYKNYSFPLTVVRPGNLFGPGQSENKFIPYIIYKLKKNDSLEVTACEQKRDFIHTADFVDLFDKLLDYPSRCMGEIINISSGKSVSLKSIIEFCKSELSSDSIINYGALPYRADEIMDFRCDISKMQNIINEEIDIDVTGSLRDYIKTL